MAIALPDYSDSDFSDNDLSPLDLSFNEASDHVRKITSKLDNNQLLELYGLFKQSTEGKCSTAKPSWLDGRGRKKWEAWRILEDMPSNEAKAKYIELVHKYDPQWSEITNHNSGAKETWVAVSSLRRSPEPELILNELTIIDAARENLGECVLELLSQHPDLKYVKDEDGLTALHWAADRDATSALNAAIKGGCEINAIDNSGQTALHYAASCGHINSTQILLKAGASIIKDDDNCTPLDLATDDEIKQVLQSYC